MTFGEVAHSSTMRTSTCCSYRHWTVVSAVLLLFLNAVYGFQSLPTFPIRSTTLSARIGLARSPVATKAVRQDVQLMTLNPFPIKREHHRFAFKCLSKAAMGFCTIAMVQWSLSVPATHAAAKTAVQATEHLHTGQKIANFFRSFGIPDLAVLAIISALPVVELRGAVPVGVWMGLPITTVFPVCVLGNMIPILPILLLLRNEKLKKLMSPILNRAEKKTAELGIGSTEKQWVSLAAFVGIPLPGTGAWTGAMGAFLLGMPLLTALTSIFAGVVAAGLIMSAISLAGRKGGIAALAALLVLTAIELLKRDKKQDS